MKKFLSTAACAFFLAAGIANAQVYVRIGPPERPVETIPPPPHEHPNWAWHDGYHHWDGNRYVWVPGYYVEPPHTHAHWVRGYWEQRPQGYVWVEGHWR